MNRVEPTIGVVTGVNMIRDMKLRDHFATASLSGLEADHTINMSFEQKAEYCYKMADAMMKERLK